MPSSIINSDNGVSSGTTGLKTTGGDDGVLNIQTNGTTAMSVNSSQVVNFVNSFTVGGSPFAGGGDYIMNVYTTPGTWTKPAGLKAIKVTVIGGGGGAGSGNFASGKAGGGGGNSIEYIDAPAIPGPQPYTVGTGGAGTPGPSNTQATSGGTSSFGGPTAFLSATGGTGGSPSSAVAAGGTGSNGQINIPGGAGIFSTFTVPGCTNVRSNSRGTSLISAQQSGILGDGITAPTYGTAASVGYGAGGMGFEPGPNAGQTGSAGVIIVEEFY